MSQKFHSRSSCHIFVQAKRIYHYFGKSRHNLELEYNHPLAFSSERGGGESSDVAIRAVCDHESNVVVANE